MLSSIASDRPEARRDGEYDADSAPVSNSPSEPFTAAERCARRLANQSEAQRIARDNRTLTLGEQVIRVPLTRDLTIPLNRTLNPYKLADLQYVLNFRTFYGLLPDVDLKEIYFEGAWQFRKDEFVLANWREMSVKKMKKEVREAHPYIGGRPVYPPGKVDVDTLNTKEEIVRMFWELTCVPWQVYQTAVGSAHVLRLVKAGDAGDAGENWGVVLQRLKMACVAGLEASLVAKLAKIATRGIETDASKMRYCIHTAAYHAAWGGHIHVFDLLASKFDIWDIYMALQQAAARGQDAMIDHLVYEHGLDPNQGDLNRWTPLHYAAESGRSRTIKHLVEKHNVDILARTEAQETALDFAEKRGYTECAAVLRGYGAPNGSPWTSDEEMYETESSSG